MKRLVDYVAVVGYDFSKSAGGESCGRLIQRFPVRSWDDYPYDFYVEAFCQPCGWQLEPNRPPPTFFVAYLTQMDGQPYYGACLTFHEAVTAQQLATISATTTPTGANSSAFFGAAGTVGVVQRHRCTSSLSDSLPGGTLPLPLSANGLPGWTCQLHASPVGSNESLASSVSGLRTSGLNAGAGGCDPNLIRPPELYAPKSLVLLARHQHFDVLKNCLSLLYTAFANSSGHLEEMIAVLLGVVNVPPTGGPRITFGLGCGDRQVIQPARFETIPVTRVCVAKLFKYVGIHNVILLFCSILSDQKVLLCSRSLNRLTESCQALTSIIYPLKHATTLVPILPKCMVEYLTAPTPFLYGIHSDYRYLLPELSDVLIADLDGGSVSCPENLMVPQLPDAYFDWVVGSLFQILSPDLLTADQIYPPKPVVKPQDQFVQDKQLRAVFLCLFASIFSGYRSCLFITRIHPQPVIHFDQSLFLLLRSDSTQNGFLRCLLQSMRFSQFVIERAQPFRVCDLFDEIHSLTDNGSCQSSGWFPSGSVRTSDLSTASVVDSQLSVSSQCLLRGSSSRFSGAGGGATSFFNFSLDRVAKKLIDNEGGNQAVRHVLPEEAVEAHKRIHQTPFPILNAAQIDDLISEAVRKKPAVNKHQYKPEPRVVPHGQVLDRRLYKAEMFPDKYRVLQEFISDIFSRHITEALKRRNTIRQDLKSRPIRYLFVDELQRRYSPASFPSTTEALDSLSGTNDPYAMERLAILSHEQFELIVQLLDDCLHQESQSEESGIAPIVMNLSTKFCTQIKKTRYYANMTHQIQKHSIWSDMPFWERLFNIEVENALRQLYIHFRSSAGVVTSASNKPAANGPSAAVETGSGQSGNFSSQFLERLITFGHASKSQPIGVYPNHLSAMEIAADELRVGHQRNRADQMSLEEQEKSTVYAQIIHFICLIVNFRIPLEFGSKLTEIYGQPDPSGHDQLMHPYTDPVGSAHTLTGSPTQRSGDLRGPDEATSGNGAWKRPPNSGFYHPTDDLESGQGPFRGRRNQTDRLSTSISPHDYVAQVEQWLQRFVQRITHHNGLLEKHNLEITGKIGSVIEGHLQNLGVIYLEVMSIPKAKKPEIVSPLLLPGEVRFPFGGSGECLHCQLLADTRHERTYWQWLDVAADLSNTTSTTSATSMDRSGGSAGPNNAQPDNDVEADTMIGGALLPAQGALFVTNYRVIFSGVPRDPYQSNKVVTRSFPVSALYSIKKIGLTRITTILPAAISSTQSSSAAYDGPNSRNIFQRRPQKGLDEAGHRRKTGVRPSMGHDDRRPGDCRQGGLDRWEETLEVLTLRSTNLQMLRLGFDPEEVGAEAREGLRNLLMQLRYPASLSTGFNVPCWSSPCVNSPLAGESAVEFVTSPLSRKTSTCGGLGAGDEALSVDTGKSRDYVVSNTSSAYVADDTQHLITFPFTDNPVVSRAVRYIEDHLSSSVVPGRLLNPKLRHMISHSPGYIDLAQCAMQPYSSHSQLVCFNLYHELVRSYPVLLIVPEGVNKTCLTKMARAHRQGRFPVVTWQHPHTKAYLLRGSGFHSNNILGALKHIGSSAPRLFASLPNGSRDGNGSVDRESNDEASTGPATSSKEQARYLLALVDMAFSAASSRGATTEDSRQATTTSTTSLGNQQRGVTSATLWQDNAAFARNKTRSLGRLAGSRLIAGGRKILTNSVTSGLANGQVGQEFCNSHQPCPPATVSDAMHSTAVGETSGEFGRSASRKSGSRLGQADNITVSGQYQPTVSLCILGEKTSMKSLAKQSDMSSVEFIPIDFVTYTAIAASFKKIVKVCLAKESSKTLLMSASALAGLVPLVGGGGTSDPNDPAAATGQLTGSSSSGARNSSSTKQTPSAATTPATISIAIQESGWPAQVQSLLELAGTIVNLLDTQGSSVALCLEDGSDIVTQAVCLAQLMLDPHYRTIVGFGALIEKEWSLFGHQFNQRLNQTAGIKSETLSPVFLQFLDAVHQLLRQFPLSFEFNDFFVQFLAYHHLSNRFSDFKYDCEADRWSSWFSQTEDALSVSGKPDPNRAQRPAGHSSNFQSIWAYAQQQHEEWPVFFNFHYYPRRAQKVLRPATNLSSLDIWDFYLSEDLATGPVYDLDHFSPSFRKTINRPYDPVMRQGFNNTHIEKVYALLGLREGEEVIGWMDAWEAAQFTPSSTVRAKARNKRAHLRSSTYKSSGYDQLPSESAVASLTLRGKRDDHTIEQQQQRGFQNSQSVSTSHKTTGPSDLRIAHSDTETDTDGKVNCSIVFIPPVIPVNSRTPSGCPAEPSSSSVIKIRRETVDRMRRLEMTVDSEDEAFHEEDVNDTLNRRRFHGAGGSASNSDEESEEEDDEECLAARSAAISYNQSATLSRLGQHRSCYGPSSFSNLLLPSPSSLETGLGSSSGGGGPGGGESDSLTSVSVASYRATNPASSSSHLTLTTAGGCGSSPGEGAVAVIFTNPHHFVRYTGSFSQTRCQFCQYFLFAIGPNSAVARCSRCQYTCHKKCANRVPPTCFQTSRQQQVHRPPTSVDLEASRRRHEENTASIDRRISARHSLEGEDDFLSSRDSATEPSSAGSVTLSPKHSWRNHEQQPPQPNDPACVGPSPAPTYTILPDKYEHVSEKPGSQLPDHSNRQMLEQQQQQQQKQLTFHHGLLYKMGHRKIFPRWKQNLFVLDTNQHQLLYYNSVNMEVVRGSIDLQEVRSVKVVKHVTQRPTTDSCVFELETGFRTYRLAADDDDLANKWVEQIQNTIQ